MATLEEAILRAASQLADGDQIELGVNRGTVFVRALRADGAGMVQHSSTIQITHAEHSIASQLEDAVRWCALSKQSAR